MATAKPTRTRDPERTRSLILQAALHEFAARGYSGARVDSIAKRAKVNKRMLYHYFGDKGGLFRAVLRHKISQRIHSVQTAAGKKSELALWFEQNCHDSDWVRLLAWESLQSSRDKVMDETERRRAVQHALVRIKSEQKAGKTIKEAAPEHLLLLLASLSMFPIAMPQLTRLITGRPAHDRKFQIEYGEFLETITGRLRP